MLMHGLEDPTVCKPCRFTPLAPTITLAGADDSIEPDHGGVPRGKDQQSSMGGGREDFKSTASSVAKLLLRAVRDSADAFPPLKSVAGGLCYLLENYEV